MDVLLVGPNIYEKNKLGGIITVVNQILSNFNNIAYFSRSPKRSGAGIADHLNLIAIFIRFHKTVRSGYNLVHINTALENTALIRDFVLCKIAKFHKKKIILHIHGGKYFSFEPSSRKKRIIISMINCAYKIIVLSKKEKESIIETYNCKNVEVLENAVEIPKLEDYGINKTFNELRFIYLGRIAPNKGLEDILEALQILQREKIRFAYKIYGNGSMLEEYTKTCKKILGEHFTYGGVVLGDEKWKAYSESNVFLLPSLFEGLPMSLLEAMASGNICITTRVGSIPEVIKNTVNGYFVEKHSPVEIAAISKKIIENKEQTKVISQNAIDTVTNSFNLANYKNRLINIYKTIE